MTRFNFLLVFIILFCNAVKANDSRQYTVPKQFIGIWIEDTQDVKKDTMIFDNKSVKWLSSYGKTNAIFTLGEFKQIPLHNRTINDSTILVEGEPKIHITFSISKGKLIFLEKGAENELFPGVKQISHGTKIEFIRKISQN